MIESYFLEHIQIEKEHIFVKNIIYEYMFCGNEFILKF